MKPLKKVFSCVMVKTNSNYAIVIQFLSIWWILSQTSILFNMSLIEHLSAVAINFWLRGGGDWFVILSYKYDKSRKIISYACFWLQVHCIVYLFFFLKMTKIKAIKEKIQNVTWKLGLTYFNAKNKYSMFGRTLPISVIMLQ